MKAINIWMLGAALLSGLASCEMKEEIFGKGVPTETGFLTLDVNAGSSAEVETKAGKDLAEGVNKNEFPLVIRAVDFEYEKEYESFSKFKEETEGTVELPIGKYEIEAHSPGEFDDVMDKPYFGGTEGVEITTGVTKPTTVVCSIQNTQIALVFTSEFQEFYSEWNITVTDGKKLTKVYTKADKDAAPVFWKMAPETDKIYVNGTATIASNGEIVPISEVLTKKDSEDYEDGDSPYFGGGDGLAISLSPITEGSINKGGIKITVKGFDQETNDDILIDVTPGGGNTPTEPGDGDGDGDGGDGENPGEFSLNFTKTECVLLEDMETIVNAEIETPGGLESLYIEITGGNDQFQNIANAVLDGGKFELINCKNSTITGALKAMGVDLPSEGALKYSFPISAFFGLLADPLMGITTTEKGHIFHVKVKDKKYGEKEGEVCVKVTEVLNQGK